MGPSWPENGRKFVLPQRRIAIFRVCACVGEGQGPETFREPPGARRPPPGARRRTPASVEATEASLGTTEASLGATEASVEATEASVEAREAFVEATEASVEAREASVEATEAFRGRPEGSVARGRVRAKIRVFQKLAPEPLGGSGGSP